jgi:hypothetical protein
MGDAKEGGFLKRRRSLSALQGRGDDAPGILRVFDEAGHQEVAERRIEHVRNVGFGFGFRLGRGLGLCCGFWPRFGMSYRPRRAFCFRLRLGSAGLAGIGFHDGGSFRLRYAWSFGSPGPIMPALGDTQTREYRNLYEIQDKREDGRRRKRAGHEQGRHGRHSDSADGQCRSDCNIGN